MFGLLGGLTLVWSQELDLCPICVPSDLGYSVFMCFWFLLNANYRGETCKILSHHPTEFHSGPEPFHGWSRAQPWVRCSCLSRYENVLSVSLIIDAWHWKALSSLREISLCFSVPFLVFFSNTFVSSLCAPHPHTKNADNSHPHSAWGLHSNVVVSSLPCFFASSVRFCTLLLSCKIRTSICFIILGSKSAKSKIKQQ